MNTFRFLLCLLVCIVALGCSRVAPDSVMTTALAPELALATVAPPAHPIGPAHAGANVQIEQAIYLFVGHPVVRTWGSSRHRT